MEERNLLQEKVPDILWTGTAGEKVEHSQRERCTDRQRASQNLPQGAPS